MSDSIQSQYDVKANLVIRAQLVMFEIYFAHVLYIKYVLTMYIPNTHL